MTATVSGPTGSWAGTHRRMFAFALLVLAIAAAATTAIVLLLSSSPAPAPTTSETTTREWPVPPEVLTDKEKCEMARVRVC